MAKNTLVKNIETKSILYRTLSDLGVVYTDDYYVRTNRTIIYGTKTMEIPVTNDDIYIPVENSVTINGELVNGTVGFTNSVVSIHKCEMRDYNRDMLEMWIGNTRINTSDIFWISTPVYDHAVLPKHYPDFKSIDYKTVSSITFANAREIPDDDEKIIVDFEVIVKVDSVKDSKLKCTLYKDDVSYEDVMNIRAGAVNSSVSFTYNNVTTNKDLSQISCKIELDVPTEDNGVLVDKPVLPITELNFLSNTSNGPVTKATGETYKAMVRFYDGVFRKYTVTAVEEGEYTHTTTIDFSKLNLSTSVDPYHCLFFYADDELGVATPDMVTKQSDDVYIYKIPYHYTLDAYWCWSLAGAYYVKANETFLIHQPDAMVCYPHIMVDNNDAYPVETKFYPYLRVDHDCVVRVFTDNSRFVPHPEVSRIMLYPEYLNVDDPYDTDNEYLNQLEPSDVHIDGDENDDEIIAKFRELAPWFYRIGDSFPKYVDEQSDFLRLDNTDWEYPCIERKTITRLNGDQEDIITFTAPYEGYRDILFYDGWIYSNYEVLNLKDDVEDPDGQPSYIIRNLDLNLDKLVLIKFNTAEDTVINNIGDWISKDNIVDLHWRLNRFYRNLLVLRGSVLDDDGKEPSVYVGTKPPLSPTEEKLWFELLVNVEPEEFQQHPIDAIQFANLDPNNPPEELRVGDIYIDLSPEGAAPSYKNAVMMYFNYLDRHRDQTVIVTTEEDTSTIKLQDWFETYIPELDTLTATRITEEYRIPLFEGDDYNLRTENGVTWLELREPLTPTDKLELSHSDRLVFDINDDSGGEQISYDSVAAGDLTNVPEPLKPDDVIFNVQGYDQPDNISISDYYTGDGEPMSGEAGGYRVGDIYMNIPEHHHIFYGDGVTISMDDIASRSTADKISLIQSYVMDGTDAEIEEIRNQWMNYLSTLDEDHLNAITYQVLLTDYYYNKYNHEDVDSIEAEIVPKDQAIQHNIQIIMSESIPSGLTPETTWINVPIASIQDYVYDMIFYPFAESASYDLPNGKYHHDSDTEERSTTLIDYIPHGDSTEVELMREVIPDEPHTINYGPSVPNTQEENAIWYEFIEDVRNRVCYADEHTMVLAINEHMIRLEFDHDNVTAFMFDDILMNFKGRLGIRYLSIVADLLNSNVIDKDKVNIFYRRLITGDDNFDLKLNRLYDGRSHVILTNDVDTSDLGIVYSNNIGRCHMEYKDDSIDNEVREWAWRHVIDYRSQDVAFIPDRMLLFVNGRLIPSSQYVDGIVSIQLDNSGDGSLSESLDNANINIDDLQVIDPNTGYISPLTNLDINSTSIDQFNESHVVLPLSGFIQLLNWDEVIDTVDVLYSIKDDPLSKLKRIATNVYDGKIPNVRMISDIQSKYGIFHPITSVNHTKRGFYDVLLEEYILNGKLLRNLRYYKDHPDEFEDYRRSLVTNFHAISDEDITDGEHDSYSDKFRNRIIIPSFGTKAVYQIGEVR